MAELKLFTGGRVAQGKLPLEQALAAMTPAQVTYVAARVRGRTRAKASEMAGVEERSVWRWEKEAWFDEAMDRERTRLLGDKQGMILPRVSAALARLDEELAGQHGDDLAHASAVYVLDQAWGRATQSKIVDNKGDPEGTASTIVEVLRALADQRRAMEGPRATVEEAPALPEASIDADVT